MVLWKIGALSCTGKELCYLTFVVCSHQRSLMNVITKIFLLDSFFFTNFEKFNLLRCLNKPPGVQTFRNNLTWNYVPIKWAEVKFKLLPTNAHPISLASLLLETSENMLKGSKKQFYQMSSSCTPTCVPRKQINEFYTEQFGFQNFELLRIQRYNGSICKYKETFSDVIPWSVCMTAIAQNRSCGSLLCLS